VASTENSCLKNLAGELLVGLSADLLVDSASAPPRSSAQLQQLSPAALAYVGDAVYELYIRTHYLFPPKRLQVYHHQVVAQVRAESQARHLKSLQPHLTETECEIVRRGRNAASKGPKRVDPDIYQQATALETLFGYLYLCDPQRLVQLLSQLQLRADSADANNADANSADANAKDAPVSLG
jgi:ribonuclease III family protein